MISSDDSHNTATLCYGLLPIHNSEGDAEFELEVNKNNRYFPLNSVCRSLKVPQNPEQDPDLVTPLFLGAQRPSLAILHVSVDKRRDSGRLVANILWTRSGVYSCSTLAFPHDPASFCIWLAISIKSPILFYCLFVCLN